MTSSCKLSVSCWCHSLPGKEVGVLFLVASFNEELSTGLMGSVALGMLSKLCFSSKLVPEMLN